MPDYALERKIRKVPAAIFSLMRAAGMGGGGTTPEDADRWAEQRLDEFPKNSDPLLRAGDRPLAALGLYPLPGETKGQLQDEILGPTDKWFPTPGLAARARGVKPKGDINLPDEGPDTAERWRTFAQEKGRQR